MSGGPPSRLPADPQAAIEMLQAELAETNREVMMLTLEMEQRVDARTAELRLAREQIEKTNTELIELTRDLEKRVQERTEALRASEERYRRAAEGLAVEARRKDQFLALLGHELRNPLAPIRTAVHMLRTSATDTDTTARMHEMIDRQVAHLAQIVDDLLDVSRIAQGRIRLQKKPLDVVQLIRTAAEDHRPDLESAGVNLHVRLPDDQLWVNGDPTRISQILGNLLHNARKFTDAGGQVTVEVRPDDNHVTLNVSDTGIGIEPEVLPTLFEPFTQSERARSRSRAGGLGLGLALVKGLAELHHGTASATSPGLGKGARFTITLPRVAKTAEREAVADQSAPRRWRILIVEDNGDAATTLAMFLESAGHSVAIAPDAASALQTAREFQPQVVLSDIGLPGGMDGYDMARAIRADHKFGDPYLVAITGFGQETDRRRAQEAGFAVHLIKPVDPRTLQRVLANVPRKADT